MVLQMGFVFFFFGSGWKVLLNTREKRLKYYKFFQYRFLLHFHLSQYKLRVVVVYVFHLKTAQSKSGSLIYGKICSLSAVF